MSHLAVLREAWRNRERSATGRMEREQAFLPAALEIHERPPSPLGRAVVWILLGLVLIAVLWAWFGETEIVAIAQGRIIPTGKTKIIQPAQISVVRAIHIREGQVVSKGDLLVELDATENQAEVNELAQQITGLKADDARLRLLLDFIKQQAKETQVYDTAAASDLPSLQKNLYHQQIAEYQAQKQILLKRMQRQQAELQTIEAVIEKLRLTLPLVEKRAEDLKTLVTKKMASGHQYLELEQTHIEVRQDLAAERGRLRQITASIEETRSELNHLASGSQRQWLERLNEIRRRLDTVQQQKIRAESRSGRLALHSPVDGIVQQLTIHTIGGVVTPAQELMKVVPKEQHLEVEAFLPNKDIGFVNVGQTASIKIETFPFTKYGTVAGSVNTLSNDAVEDEKLGLVYAMGVEMTARWIMVENKRVKLSPGMAVTVEIKTGARRLIEFFLAPLLRYRDESVRER